MDTSTMFSGGPGEINPNINGSSVGQTVDQANTQVNQVQPTLQPIYLGGKRFETQDELAAYLANQERENIELKARMNYSQPAPQMQNPPASKISDIFFEDTEAAIKLIKEQTKQEIYNEYNARETEKQVWNDFYTKNVDLKTFPEVVDMKRNQLWNSLKDMPIEQATSLLAKESREYIQKIRGVPAQTQVLPSGPAITSGVSGEPTKTVNIETKPMTFAEQMRKMQQARWRK